MSRLVARVAGVVFVTVLGASLAVGQNLVTNGEFDTGVAGWTEFSAVTLSWDSQEDYAGQPGSGSALIVNDNLGQSNSGATQCVEAIVGGESYILSTWLLAPSGQQSAQGSAKVFVWWYSEAGCTGYLGQGPATSYITTSDVWVERVGPAGMAPTGTQSAIVYLNNAKTSDTPGVYRVWYDHVVLRNADEIFSDGFESGSLSAWSSSTR